MSQFRKQGDALVGNTVEGIINFGLLIQDMDAATKKERGSMSTTAACNLWWGYSAAKVSKFRTIGEHAARMHKHRCKLPQSWTAIYSLAMLPPSFFDEKIEAGVINPGIERSVLKVLHQTGNPKKVSPGKVSGAGLPKPSNPNDIAELVVNTLPRLDNIGREEVLQALLGIMEPESIAHVLSVGGYHDAAQLIPVSQEDCPTEDMQALTESVLERLVLRALSGDKAAEGVISRMSEEWSYQFKKTFSGEIYEVKLA